MLLSYVQDLNRIASTESEPEQNPEMVAGRLEIRVVSTPISAANGGAEDKPDVISNVPPGTDPPLTNRANLQQAESEIANQVDKKIKTF